MAEKPNVYFLNNAVDYTIKRIKEAGEKFNSKELKGAMQYEDVLSLMFAFGAQWRKDTDPNKSDYIEILDSVLNEYTEVIEKEKKAEEERQKRQIPSAECWETHNKLGTKGVNISILEDTKPENPEPEVEVIISDATIRSRLKEKPDNGLNRKLFSQNDSANLRYILGAMSDEQFKAFMEGKEDEFLRILLGGK